jgi:Ser/Thr protein kinase RdoA (MazF antagonist)
MSTTEDPLDAAVLTALKEWDLEVKTITLASRSENVVFKVTTASEETLALRFHRPGYNTLDELNSEVVWSDALNLAGIPTPAHIAAKSGAYYVPIAGPGATIYQVGLIRWIPGELLDDRIKQASEHNAKTYFHSLGALLANLHNQTSTWRAPTNFERRSWHADGLVGPDPLWGKFWQAPALTPTQQHYLEEVRKQVHNELRQLSMDETSYGLIHADLHPRNVIVYGDGAALGLQAIDFDDCGYGWHYYDIAVALNEFSGHDNAPSFQESLLDGYRSKRAIIDAERHLPLFFLIRVLISLGWLSARPELSSTEQMVRRVPAIIDACENYLG